jgi:uncharacterized protein YjcR
LRNPVSDKTKTEIVKLWLAGTQRDRIAEILNVSAGTTSNAISIWKQQLGVPTADALRVFGTELRESNITAIQCAEAFRFVGQLKNFGILPNEIVPFVKGIHMRCISSNVSADKIFAVCKQISALNISKSLSELPESISDQIKTKQTLEKDIAILGEKKNRLHKEYSNMFEQSRITEGDLEKYKVTRQRL